MTRAKLFVSIVVILLVTACGSVAPPEAEFDAAAAATASRTADGFAFLPPVGPAVDSAGFYAGASLIVEVRAIDGAGGLLTSFSTAAGTVRVQDEHYLALWRVSDTVAANRGVTLVRVSVFASGLASGSALAEACSGDPCEVGSFDAMIRKSKSVKAGSGILDLTRTQTLPIRMHVLGATNRATTLDALTPLTPGLTFEGETQNCAANEFTLPGQGLHALGSGLHALGSGLHALGSVGGLFLLGDVVDPGNPPGIRLFEPKDAAELVLGILPADPEALRSSAILVVDDFGPWPPVFDLGPALTGFDGTPQANPSLAESEAFLDGLVSGGGFSHGALVLDQTLRMVEAAGFVSEFGGFGSLRIFRHADGNGFLVVAAVNTNQLDTEVIATQIDNALRVIRYYSELDAFDGFDVRRFAINMSFVIVPCAVLADFDASGLDDFEAYARALGEENGVAVEVEEFYDELVAVLLTPLELDGEPLLEQISSCANGYAGQNPFETPDGENQGGDEWEWPYLPWDLYYLDFEFATLVQYPEEFIYADIPDWGCDQFGASVVYVGATGNFGLPYPMYPAAWPMVVGAASQDADTPEGFTDTKSSFSNSGEVMAPGALYQLVRSDTAAQAIAYAGTSFAAPVVTFLTALDQMMDAPTCTLDTTSKLTFAADDANVPLEDAVPCP
jgi:hypothetical protein